ncbi:hypothetical protein JD969_05645 [Planctomycetota bacterium]|nr:hypothetical protein JD969_05645 [Planctomycetota bacterium]
MRYHHMGIPTNEKKEGMRRLADLKMWVCGYEESEFKVEWMYFEEECALPELVRTVPHVAFEVESVAEAIRGKKVIIEPTSPSEGLVVAFVEENGVPIEFVEVG